MLQKVELFSALSYVGDTPENPNSLFLFMKKDTGENYEYKSFVDSLGKLEEMGHVQSAWKENEYGIKWKVYWR